MNYRGMFILLFKGLIFIFFSVFLFIILFKILFYIKCVFYGISYKFKVMENKINMLKKCKYDKKI